MIYLRRQTLVGSEFVCVSINKCNWIWDKYGFSQHNKIIIMRKHAPNSSQLWLLFQNVTYVRFNNIQFYVLTNLIERQNIFWIAGFGFICRNYLSFQYAEIRFIFSTLNLLLIVFWVRCWSSGNSWHCKNISFL